MTVHGPNQIETHHVVEEASHPLKNQFYVLSVFEQFIFT